MGKWTKSNQEFDPQTIRFIAIANNAASKYFQSADSLEYAMEFGMHPQNGSRYGNFIKAVVGALQQSEGEREL